MTRIATSLIVGLWMLALAGRALAQEQSTEASSLYHVFDEPPLWEAPRSGADLEMIGVTLEAPAELAVCRQGRVVTIGTRREAHMGCWPHPESGPALLQVPAGDAFLAVHRGGDLTWIGNGATPLRAGDALRLVFEDRLPLRIAGWITGAVGIVAGAVLLGVATAIQRGRVNPELAIAGGVVGAASIFVAMGLVLAGDGFHLTVVREPDPPGAP